MAEEDLDSVLLDFLGAAFFALEIGFFGFDAFFEAALVVDFELSVFAMFSCADSNSSFTNILISFLFS